MARIDLRDLCFHYTQGDPVLRGVSLTLDGGAIALVGQNGAGKTTLVKLIKGLLQPISGDILLDGESIRGKTAASLAGQIGLVFQNPGDQIFKSRVLDEVLFGPLNLGADEALARRDALAALDAVGLGDLLDENPYDLGLTQRKLVTVASILAMDTPIVLFDEPTIAQDHAGREKIKSIIQSLKRQGRMVITIIHDMDFVAECFDRVVVLVGGEVLLDGPPAQVYGQEELLRRAHLEPPHVARLCRKLGYRRVFLTADEFVGYLAGNKSDENGGNGNERGQQDAVV